MLEFLPEYILEKLSKYVGVGLQEVRVRRKKPIFALINGKWEQLDCKFPSAEDIQTIVLKLTKHSVYRFEQTIKNGYLIGDCGERIGLSGECVDDGTNRFIKNVSSVCVRVQNEIIGCSERLLEKLFSSGVKNLLVISPPGAGKTTFLRDVARVCSDYYAQNVLLCDEKGEFCGNSFKVGYRTDVVKYSKKSFVMSFGVLNMRPDVIVLDELSDEEDIQKVVDSGFSGIKIMASAHGKNTDDVKSRQIFKPLFDNKIIDYSVVLSQKNGVGTIEQTVRL